MTITRIGIIGSGIMGSGIAEVAEEFGISRDDWDGAVTGWNSRFAHDTPAAVRFNALWRGVG